jgi:hypothetical protein
MKPKVRGMIAYLLTFIIVLVIILMIPGLIEFHPGNWLLFQEEVKEHIN